MEPVKSLDDVRQNCDTLLEYLRSTGSTEEKFAKEAVRKGTCFLPVRVGRELFFWPSRFIGYRTNTIRKHLANDEKDGRLTNGWLSTILMSSPVEDESLEEAYKGFCIRVGIQVTKTGNFGVKRKFWPTDVRSTVSPEQLDDLQDIINDPALTDTEKLRLTAERIGQVDFRQSLIAEWGCCAVTGCTTLAVLRASHIKPWRSSTSTERVDPKNGLLLTPNLDTAFDRYFITFEDTGKIAISQRLSASDRDTLGLRADMRLRLAVCPERKVYLSHHQQMFREANT
jgi:hypothetical protein